MMSLNEILETILTWVHNLADIYSQAKEKMHNLHIAVHFLTKAYSVY